MLRVRTGTPRVQGNPTPHSDTGGGGVRLSRLATGHRACAARSGLYCLAPLLHPRQSRGLVWCAEVVRQSGGTARSAVQAVGLRLLAARLFDLREGLSVSTGREARRAEAGRNRRPGVGGPTTRDAARSA